jgi:Mn2+/Fe2+ NRAMP family transporter
MRSDPLEPYDVVSRPGHLRPAPRKASWLAAFLLALGPGVIGLSADNDAGGMLSYLVTGSSHGLTILVPTLLGLGLPTLFIGWLALRVADTTHLPYSKALVAGLGVPFARLEALVLYGINGLIMVTEFVGMTLSLSLVGLPTPVGLALTFAAVLLLTTSRVYARIERQLLTVALGSLLFIPALLFVHPSTAALGHAFSARVPDAAFLVLAMAGNAIPPWMVYWQQNAVWAGPARTSRQRLLDLVTGQVAMIVMAGTVLLLGAVMPGRESAFASPVAWIFHDGGHVAGVLFAVGLFDAGLLAACTVSLSSLWTVREAMGRGARHPAEAPNRGRWRYVHVATLAAAAAVVLLPTLSVGSIALWAQAVGALWMPASLTLLGLVASNRRVMGDRAIGRPAQAAVAAMTLGYLVLAWMGIGI